jgi:hypothetical protein
MFWLTAFQLTVIVLTVVLLYVVCYFLAKTGVVEPNQASSDGTWPSSTGK